MRWTSLVSVLGVALLPTGGTLAQAPPPKAPVREVVDTYFGQKVVDPYRWTRQYEPDRNYAASPPQVLDADLSRSRIRFRA